MPKRINWKIAGSAGHGIKSVGSVMARAILRHGWYVFGYDEYPSLIRGGHNTYQLLISEEEVFAPQKTVDILLALNEEGVVQHTDELSENCLIIKDEWIKVESHKGKVLNLPILNTAKKLGNPLVQNTILLGVTAELFGLEDEIMRDLIQEEFGKKVDLLEINFSAYEEGRKMVSGEEEFKLPVGERSNDLMVMTGSEAAGMGAIAAGVQGYFAYPMTPSSPLLHFMADHQEEFNYLVRQPEDEIGAINTAIGASYAGAKTMVGTAGGGFALMQEGVSLAAMLELPLVVYMGMRPGPATGMPTWTSQADLRFVVHAGHGEFPKIVLSPGDTKEAYEMLYKAFDLSQRYQVTVIVLTDKHLAESHFVTRPFAKYPTVSIRNIEWQPSQPETEMFHRFQTTPDGIAKRTLPGVANGFYIANSDEHNPEGLVDESASMREIMNTRRMNKTKLIVSEALLPSMYGDANSKLCLVSWGSTKGSVLTAAKELGAGFCHFTQVWPIAADAKEMLKEKEIVVIENNLTGQFEGILRQELGIETSRSLRRDDGRPFFPEEIVEFVKKSK